MSEAYDRSHKRPLELRVYDRREEGGISEDDAAQRNGVTADAFMLMRALIDEGQVAISFAAIDGTSGGPLSFEVVFNLWLAMTSHIAQYKTERQDQEGMRKFAERVLNLMRLNTELTRLQADVAVENRPS